MPRPRRKDLALSESAKRLDSVIFASGLSIAQFAERIGMTPSGFGGVFLRGAEVSGLQARAVELEFGVSYRWILTGEGSCANLEKPKQVFQIVEDIKKIKTQIEKTIEAQNELQQKLKALGIDD